MKKTKLDLIIEIHKKHTLIEELTTLEKEICLYEDDFSYMEVQIIDPRSKIPFIRQEIATHSLQFLIKDKIAVLKEEMEVLLGQIAIKVETLGGKLYRT